MCVSAYACICRYYDAARSYGRAEEFLSSWLRGLPPDALGRTVVGSKWGYYYTADWQVRGRGGRERVGGREEGDE